MQHSTVIFSCLRGSCLSFVLLFLMGCHSQVAPEAWIRVNQIGYLPDDLKVAVLCGKGPVNISSFSLVEAGEEKEVWKGESIQPMGAYGPFTGTYRLDFSAVKESGRYYLQAGSVRSPEFSIGKDIYQGAADFLLRYMRQQRCGFNPFLKDSCHLQDGFMIYGPEPDGTDIDVTGGWHDATDYLQYTATSANATYNLLFAYRDFPEVFGDSCQANGLPGPNGIPDVLDEARWGLDWLLKMHPREEWMFNQIADDRDHAGFRLPNKDSVRYREGPGRPVYFCTGETQGLFDYKNRATGVASTAGKFASAFALGATLYGETDPQYAGLLAQKAKSAFQLGLDKPGACQTAPGKAPYFYEEDNWVDDMELGSAALHALTGEASFLQRGLDYAREETVTPWIPKDTARHYQWYPFVNLGHYELARQLDSADRKALLAFYREGIETVWARARQNGFLRGIPFVWCSNNLTAAFATQCYLYRQLSGDDKYLELELACRDWLFGCNPWGVSMVIGLPETGVYAQDPHSSLHFLHGYKLDGALLDGPVFGSVFQNLRGLTLREPDEYAEFQSQLVVYHDDVGDYSTNEPTMDGTATLMYYLAAQAHKE